MHKTTLALKSPEPTTDGYFRYAPPRLPGVGVVYVPVKWVATRKPPAEITIEADGLVAPSAGGLHAADV